jgi:hypothetical protein
MSQDSYQVSVSIVSALSACSAVKYCPYATRAMGE